MKPKILKYIILGICGFSLVGILLGTFYFISATLSFFNDDELSIPFTSKSSSNFEGDNFLELTEKRSLAISDLELHYQKKGFGEANGDTIFITKYITFKNSRHQLKIEKAGLPANGFTGPGNINEAFYQIESLKSIPFEKLDNNFWEPFLLSRIITKSIFYICIISLIISITINAFKTTPFTYKIRNKLYFLAGLMLLLVTISWIFNNILSNHLLEYYQINNGPNFFYNTWFLMGILMIFIATIFNYGDRLQKEQDLTI